MQLAIVVPCYNEEQVLKETAGRLLETLTDLQAKGKVSRLSRIHFVDDGSRDSTWEIIQQLSCESTLSRASSSLATAATRMR
jgi:glycosyltransferase involved in cell wall biosynthesis